MPLALDHLVVVVPSLEEGRAAFEAAGFTVTPGGRHEGIPTENALVVFADGSYLELLAARDPGLRPHLRERARGEDWARTLHEATALGRRFLPLLAGPDGVADLVLRGAPLARLAREARRRGHVLTGPTAMQRVRPDGEVLSWQLLLPERLEIPFLIEDVTSRERRVPRGPEAVTHPNGASGLAHVAVNVASVPVAAMTWADLLGLTPRVDEEGATRFTVGATSIRLQLGEREGAREAAVRAAAGTQALLAAWGVRFQSD